jgi:hypothetical protein
MDEIVITVKGKPIPVGGKAQQWEAWYGEELLCVNREPFFAAARVLVARGVPKDAPIVMKHAGNDMVCLRSTVGKAASLAVAEGAGQRIRTTKYQPDPRALRAESR